jgi:hypothetical protein
MHCALRNDKRLQIVGSGSAKIVITAPTPPIAECMYELETESGSEKIDITALP